MPKYKTLTLTEAEHKMLLDILSTTLVMIQQDHYGQDYEEEEEVDYEELYDGIKSFGHLVLGVDLLFVEEEDEEEEGEDDDGSADEDNRRDR